MQEIMNTREFDAVDYLDSEESITAYLRAVLEENNPELFFAAISDVARVRGIAKLAEDVM